MSFSEACERFTSNTDFLAIFDEDHSEDEDRFVAVLEVHPRGHSL